MGSELVLVAVGVDANKEISTDYALEWTVQNVIKAEDFLILLAVLPSSQRPTPNLNRRRGKRHNEGNSFGHVDQHKRDISRQINNVYVNKMQQLRLASNLMQVHYEVKVIFDAHLGSVATKAKELKASWVILDRLLKKEADHCIKQLNCNVVLIDDAIPRILKAVNPLAGENSSESMNQSKPTGRGMLNVIPNIMDYKNATTPSSSDIKTSTFGTYSFSMPSTDKEYKCETKTNPSTINNSHAFLHLNSEYFDENFEYLETFNLSPPDFKSKHLNKISSLHINELNHKSHTSPLHGEAENSSDILRTENSDRKHHFERTDRVPTLARRLTDSSCIWRGPDSPVQPNLLITRRDSMASSNKHESEPSSSVTADGNSIVRKAISLSITSPPAPPAHCSICKKQKTPVFRNAPRKFTYREIEKATDGFSDTNFMTEGGYGCLYRGKLNDGQVIAVKQFKKLKAVAVSEFCLEVETLGCLQHRNLLMLVGYCIDTKWLLIYEFACNGSLGKHLYGTKTNQVMGWHHRMKVAIGTARGLRYFHEDCRAGCIVHRDLRPSNILLTHDFEPMVFKKETMNMIKD